MHILIIEDSEKLAKSLKTGLEQEGYAVDYILDGLEGEKRLELNHKYYDLLILDLTLPNRSGLEICKNIRNKNILLPIIMLTAKDTTEDKIFGLDTGADDYMIKPFSFEELLSRIRALSRRPKESLPVELSVNGVTLNTSTKKVHYNGKEILLTLKEFRLLEYLMAHAGQVITRDQIFEHLWDFAFDTFSRVVDVHINNLRTKLNKKNNEDIIETIRGLGYRFKR
jgi:DNA-binding response OmpR family regulator